MEFRYSEFNGLGNIPRGKAETLETFANRFTHFKVTSDKKSVETWSPSLYKAGYTRSAANVEAITGLVYDFDDKDEAFKQHVLQSLDGYYYIVHSTFSNGQPGKGVRFRAVLPFEKPISPRGFKKFYAEVAAHHGWADAYDKKLSHPAALVFWPSLATETSPHFLHFGEGKFLEVAATPAEIHTPAAEKAQQLSSAGVIVGVKNEKSRDEDSRLLKIRLHTMRNTANVELVERLRNGKSLADVGERDAALQRAVSVVAFRLNDEQLTGLDEDIILDYLQPSIDATPYTDEDDRLTRDDAREKLRRARRDALAKREEAKSFENVFKKSEKRERPATEKTPAAPSLDDSRSTYSEDAAKEISSRFCFGKNPSWVVQKGGTVYYLTKDGYEGPYSVSEYTATIKDTLRRAPISVQTIDSKGNLKDMKLSQILERHGRSILDYRGSFVVREHTYDIDTKTFTAAVCPLRDLSPLETPEVDKWLRFLGGEHVEKFLDWVATVTDLSRTTCAVYLEGAPRTGKSLFAAALSRLWNTTGPTEMAGVLGTNFNAELLQCPLIMADEALPKGFKGESLSSQLRELVGVHSRTVNQKFQPAMRVEGAVRVVMAGNNSNLLQFREGLTEDDMQAVAERILHVRVSPQAADYIAELGSERVRQFVEGDLVARHALWLRDTRRVLPLSRFLVTGSLAEVHTRLRMSSGHNSEVIEFLVTCMLHRSAAEKARQAKTLFVKDGNLYVSSQVFQSDAWEFHVSDGKRRGLPPKKDVMQALRSISTGPDSITIWLGDGKAARVWKMNTDVLLQWADDNGMDLEKFQKLLKGEESGPSANSVTQPVAATEIN